MNLTVQLHVKQTLWSKILMNMIFLLLKLRLMPLKLAVKITNFTLRNGAFKQKLNNGKWKKLDVKGEFVVDCD